MRNRRINLFFVIIISVLTLILIFLPTGFENPSILESTFREKAIVLKVDNADLQTHAVVTTGSQKLLMQIQSGSFKGDTVSGYNILMGQKKIDKVFEKGDEVFVVLKINKSGDQIISARADDYYRIHIELILFGLFALFLIAFAGLTGFKALLSFVFTALAIWKVLIPLFLKGYSPVPVALVILFITTGVIILLISGFSRKGLVAVCGSLAGIALTSFLALLFGDWFRVPGTIMDFSETLLYSGFTQLKLTDIFLSGIFISAAGAVMDVAMDIAAAQNELIEKKPGMGVRELMLSGFNIAYPVIGTMTTTLLFAYSGGFIFIFMAFMAKGTPIDTIFNTNYIAGEVLNTLVGSFGLVLVAPATAIIGGYVYTRKP
ncbi:YibE/F family protein [Marinilabilia salmonicolor]|jgi:uncharacterized membrane protein|uniref:Putative membrane protein n=1 Tax=Marinilabilia salmonicolor TaxID=989 RepID=A0A2T0WZ96_9BACT|nr:YibE/F family protein [Marinilabilia salmonicolor]PRY91987.1 putative membrane protein [Marinilabilia salmonicolor]RCW26098.1 putative membrane protein [Marinilabilia salmonicolor]